MIAHRPGTLRRADTILRIENGRLLSRPQLVAA
jgi:ABC-type multidrug transport system fused ATPase/permease subunit